jgi:hypothetical protein
MSNAVRCKTFLLNGVLYWEAPDGQTIARREAIPGGWLVERFPSCPPSPPFVQLLPCPWCGVEEDRDHGEGHVDPRLGVPISLRGPEP